jgi:hypothetical protein
VTRTVNVAALALWAGVVACTVTAGLGALLLAVAARRLARLVPRAAK